ASRRPAAAGPAPRSRWDGPPRWHGRAGRPARAAGGSCLPSMLPTCVSFRPVPVACAPRRSEAGRLADETDADAFEREVLAARVHDDGFEVRVLRQQLDHAAAGVAA